MKSTPQSLTSATSWRGWFVFTVLFITLGTFSALASDTWTGAGSNSNWTNGSNWSTGAPPVVGDSVTMLGPGHTDNTANVGGVFPTWTLDILQFASQAPSFTIHIRGQDAAVGPGMTITGGVINLSVQTQFLEVDPGNYDTAATPGALRFTGNALVLQVQIDNNGGTAVAGNTKEGGTTTFSGSSSVGLATMRINYPPRAWSSNSVCIEPGVEILLPLRFVGWRDLNPQGADGIDASSAAGWEKAGDERNRD